MCHTRKTNALVRVLSPRQGRPNSTYPRRKPHSIRKFQKAGKTLVQRTIPENGALFQNLGTSQSRRDKFSWTSRFQNLKPWPFISIEYHARRNLNGGFERYLLFFKMCFDISAYPFRQDLPCCCAIKYCFTERKDLCLYKQFCERTSCFVDYLFSARFPVHPYYF